METLLSKKFTRAGFMLLVVLSAYFLVKTFSEIKNYNFIGGAIPSSNTMTFDGKGEVSAVPDIATISFAITQDSKTAKEAQVVVTEKTNKALALLKQNKIDDKDIKTTNYSSYPKYEYQQASKPCMQNYCPPGQQVLTGYEVSQNIDVKIRNLDSVGKVVEGLVGVGVTNMNGPSFAIDKEDSLKDQARKLAIDDAKAKADKLSRDLGIRLVRIVNFSENGNYPMPMMYNKARFEGASADVSSTPALPAGENKIISNVNITYEIR